MLESTSWIEKNFSESPDAIFIFQNDELLISNQAAKTLLENYHFSLTYLCSLMQSVLAQQRNDTDDCFHCAIKEVMPNRAIPVTLKTADNQKLAYFLVVTPLDAAQHTYSLTLKSNAMLQRMDQVAQQRKLVQYVNRAHEEERKRLSQDLHDSIAQGVYSAIMGIRHLEPATAATDQDAFRSQAKLIENQLYETLSEVKGMALDIRPSVLDSFGLVPALKALAQRLEENTGITINVIARAETENLSEDVQTVFYRIAQESMTNAIKHAKCSEINLILIQHPHRISLEIIDDGTGFDTQQMGTFNGHSLGLMNMNERVKALQGTFHIDSSIGNGTTVRAEFPVV
jgi:two-component system sensor histidine kinase NreB